MAFAKNWNIITPGVMLITTTTGTLGEREGLHFYNRDTGAACFARIDDDGQVATVKYQTLLPGWSDIVCCNRHPMWLFYDRQTGTGSSVGFATGWGWTPHYPPGSFTPGWTNLLSDGYRLLFYEWDSGVKAEGIPEIPLGRAPRFEQSRRWFSGPHFTAFASCSNYVMQYRGSDGIYVTYPVWSYMSAAYGNSSFPEQRLPQWSHLTGIRDRLFFYNAWSGQAEVGRLTQEGRYVPLASYALFPFWSHVVATGDHLLFYQSFSGRAATWLLAPDGTFVQQQFYL
jgi:hypothetical protein